MSRKRAIRDFYAPRILPGRPSHEVLDWADSAGQLTRFRILAENVDLTGRSLLDVGCGLGDLLEYLDRAGIAADYTGVDIVPEMVEAARRRHPAGEFIVGDIFSENPFLGRRFDVAFCSGLFNLNVGNNRGFLAAALPAMFALATGHVVFNLLHAWTPDKHPHCVYFDPAEVVPMVETMSDRVRIVDDYLPNDFTVVCTLPAPGGK